MTVPEPPRTLPYEHVKVAFRGTIQSSQTWATGFTVIPSGSTPSPSGLQTWLTFIAGAALQSFLTRTNGWRTLCSSDTLLTRMDAYLYAPDAATASAQATATVSTNNNGAGTGQLPTQCAVVASLRSNIPGRSGRGRMYWPCTGFLLGGHQLSILQTDAMAQSVATYLTAVNAAPLGAAVATVVIGTSKLTNPPIVTRVVCDSEIDIQRRRADKITAALSSQANVT